MSTHIKNPILNDLNVGDVITFTYSHSSGSPHRKDFTVEELHSSNEGQGDYIVAVSLNTPNKRRFSLAHMSDIEIN